MAVIGRNSCFAPSSVPGSGLLGPCGDAPIRPVAQPCAGMPAAPSAVPSVSLPPVPASLQLLGAAEEALGKSWLREGALLEPNDPRARLVCSSPPVWVIDGFLSKEDSEIIISENADKLMPSEVMANPDEPAANLRTSSSVAAKAGSIPVKKIKAQVSKLFNIDLKMLEMPAMVRYQPGQEYKGHFDWFKGDAGGQREWTLLLYLNELDPEDGGETVFLAAEPSPVMIRPRVGRAVIWRNLLPDGTVDKRTLHAGLPPKRGEKYAMNIWTRTGLLGPGVNAEETEEMITPVPVPVAHPLMFGMSGTLAPHCLPGRALAPCTYPFLPTGAVAPVPAQATAVPMWTPVPHPLVSKTGQGVSLVMPTKSSALPPRHPLDVRGSSAYELSSPVPVPTLTNVVPVQPFPSAGALMSAQTLPAFAFVG